ncbi:MAG: Gfo/Idh/MocA family protein [Promethearchaeota archaeon]
MKSKITAVLIGAGNRGLATYGMYALKNPNKLKFIAVAEPVHTRREKFSRLHKIKKEFQFKDCRELLEQGKIADVAFICTQDRMHVDPTIEALKMGYDVMLEKPMAHDIQGCIKIANTVKETNRILGVAHVLRYTKFFSTIKKVVQKGLLGTIINMSHRENVSWYHIAHSFVRGNWRREDLSSPLILAKCCHDLDLIYWIMESLPKKISSFGSLMHFKEENAPKGAPKHCLDGCPAKDSCLYYAPRIYIDIEPIVQIMTKSDNRGLRFLGNLRRKNLHVLSVISKFIPLLKSLRYWSDWPVEPLYFGQPEELSGDFSDEAKYNILKRSPYGRCVYKCDNNVVDHQVVNIEFRNQATATLTVHGFSEREGRTLRIDGTKATLIGEFHDCGQKITLFDHFKGSEKIIFYEKLKIDDAGHGGGDFSFIDSFIQSILDKRKDEVLTRVQDILESHLMAFAAEKSRKDSIVVDMDRFRNEILLQLK